MRQGRRPWAAWNLGIYCTQIFIRGNTEFAENLRHKSLLLNDQGVQQMLTIYLLMSASNGKILRLGNGILSFFRKKYSDP